MILVDSSVWIDYFNGTDTLEANRLDALLGIEPAGLGDLILVEVLQGFRLKKDFETAIELLSTLTIFDLSGKDIAIKSANNFRLLRKKGITVRKTADVIIATFCIDNNIPLLFSDRDFVPFQRHLGLINAYSST